MASPQEVIEQAIPHPADSTPSSRREASNAVIQALGANKFYFVHRQLPVMDRDDGECPTCKCSLVHIMHASPYYNSAEDRMRDDYLRIQAMLKAGQTLITEIDKELVERGEISTEKLQEVLAKAKTFFGLSSA